MQYTLPAADDYECIIPVYSMRICFIWFIEFMVTLVEPSRFSYLVAEVELLWEGGMCSGVVA